MLFLCDLLVCVWSVCLRVFLFLKCLRKNKCLSLSSDNHPHPWKKLYFAHHWPVTVCKVRFLCFSFILTKVALDNKHMKTD